MSAGVKSVLLAFACLLSTSGQAGLFDLRGEVVTEAIAFECEESSEPFFCFGAIRAVGDRSAFRLFVDVGTRLAQPWGSQHSHSIQSDHVFAKWRLDGSDGEYASPLFSGTSDELIHIENSYVSMNFSQGKIHGMSIYAYGHDALAGDASIQLNDSEGTAFAALDLRTNETVDDWLANHFDLALFDSGSWWVSTFDGGGGASGHFSVPLPSSMVLLGVGLLLLGLSGWQGQRLRADKRGQPTASL